MADYTTEENVENYLLLDIDSNFSSNIDKWIDSVEQYIDNYTNRTFGTSSSASKRKYDGDDTQKLIIDDAHEIVSVERDIDDSALGSDEWYSIPANEKPYTAIQTDSKIFPEGIQNITVEAKWGYGSVPNDIELAATIFTAGVIGAGTKTDQEVSKEQLGDYSVWYKEDTHWADFEQAQQIIESYKRYSF